MVRRGAYGAILRPRVLGAPNRVLAQFRRGAAVGSTARFKRVPGSDSSVYSCGKVKEYWEYHMYVQQAS